MSCSRGLAATCAFPMPDTFDNVGPRPDATTFSLNLSYKAKYNGAHDKQRAPS